MPPEIATVILRFRDLALRAGETIRLHKEVIEEHGATWWGWWAPGDEQPADDALRSLRERALSAEGLEAYLFDSGRKLVFRVRCDDIKWDIAHNSITSPDPRQTPAYYADSEHPVWFHFTEIEHATLADVHRYSYVDVPELFKDPGTTYTAFAGKRIASVEELHLQRRTMWFVRDATVTDPTHEILLYGRDVIEPRDFQSRFLVSRESRLLWLSDLHYSAAAGRHAFPTETSGDGDRRSLSTALRTELERLNKPTVAGLIVSGDLTWRADPAEFAMAENALRVIGAPSNLLLDPHRVAIVPGNHDVRFSTAPDDASAEVTIAPHEARRAYEDFYAALFNRAPNAFLSIGRRFLMNESIPVEIVLLNSSLLEQVPEPEPGEEHGHRPVRFQGQGFIGDAQLRDAAAKMRWHEPRAGHTIRIVVLHHHLIPVSYSEPAAFGANYSTVLDSGRLARWLVDNRVDVVLHGHQHGPFLARVARPIDERNTAAGWHSFYVVGLGSAGVAPAFRPTDVPNMFGLLDFADRRVNVTLYSIDQTQASQELASFALDLGSP